MNTPLPNVLLLSAEDNGPGANRAAYRLHQGFRQYGMQSHMLVQTKSRDDVTVFGNSAKSSISKVASGTRLILDHAPLKFYPKRDRVTFSPQWLPDTVSSKVAQLNPDIIHLHWINEGYLQIETLAKFKKPIVWTLRDMWSFTGGCHYTGECDRYINHCGQCPQLNSQTDWDLSRWIWQRKANSWKSLDLTVVALSSWMGECARASSLFKDLRIEVIPNGINTKIYRPLDKHYARELLGLPHDKQLVLFGAVKATSDRRKGFHLLQPALKGLSQAGWQDKLELVVFGASRHPQEIDFGFKSHYLGILNDDLSLALTYAAADVLVAPSIQENLANTVLEALACGTPCAAFDIGGMPDMIEHQKNGFLAQPYEIEDLEKGISWILENQERHQTLSCYAREKIEREFDQELRPHSYLSLFAEILNKKHSL